METQCQINRHIIWRVLDGKLFIYNESNFDMFCLDGSVIPVWNLLAGHDSKDLGAELDKLSSVSDIDVDSFLSFLLERGIIMKDDSLQDTNLDVLAIPEQKKAELWDFIHRYTGKYYPVTVTWEITYKCNQHCIHCYEDCPQDKAVKDFDTATIIQHLKEIHDDGCFVLCFNGGEPFVRKDFFEILRAAREMNFSIVIYTNASLLTSKDVSELKKIGISQMRITLFSMDSQIHEQIARQKNVHRNTIQSIERLSALSIPVRVNVPIMKLNFDGYQDVIQFCEDNQCDYKISPGIIYRDDGDDSTRRNCISDEQYLSLYNDKRTKFSSNADDLSSRLESISCNIVCSGLTISPDGRVYPCNSYRCELGNIATQRLMDIWENSDILKILRNKKIKDIETCNCCKLLPYCSPCPAFAWSDTGRYFGKSAISCYSAQMKYMHHHLLKQ